MDYCKKIDAVLEKIGIRIEKNIETLDDVTESNQVNEQNNCDETK